MNFKQSYELKVGGGSISYCRSTLLLLDIYVHITFRYVVEVVCIQRL